MTTYDLANITKIKRVSFFSLLRYAFLFRSNPLNGFVKLANRNGDLFKIKLFGQELYFVNHPDHIRHVLQDKYLDYPRAHTLEPFSELLGDGLFRADNELWERMHKTLLPAFHQEQINNAFSTITSETTNFLENQLVTREGVVVANVELEMKRLALKICAKLLLSPQLEINTDPMIDALSDIAESADLAHHTRRKMRIAISRTFPMKRRTSRIVTEAFEYIHGLSQHIVEEFFTKTAEKGYFLELLYNAYHANEISIDHVIHEIKTLLFAGFDTVAGALTWTLYSIDKVPGLRKKLEAEVDNAFPDGQIRMEKLSGLPLLTQTIKESLRLYPPVWSFHRIAFREDVIGNNIIPRNAWIMISPYALHRNPKLWPDPEVFNIDRFANEDNGLPNRYDYIPFGQGPHICIGSQMAMFEITIILAQILQRYRITFRTREKPVFKSQATLQSKKLILNNISKRHDSKIEG
jgi:cytochrome P450